MGTAHKAVCVKAHCAAERLPGAATKESLKERGNRTMKKSFLKRVAAAIVAVPVAMTQTALFTTFAVDGETTAVAANTTGSTVLSLDDLMKIDASVEPVLAADFKSAAALKNFSAAELKKANAYVQVSDWGVKASNGLESFQGKYNLDKTAILNAIAGKDNISFELLTGAIKDENTTAVAEIKDGKIVITMDINYAYGENLAKMSDESMNKTIDKKYDDVDITFKPLALSENKLVGSIVLTADTSKIEDKTVKYTVSVKFGGEEQKGVKAIENFFADEAEKALADLRLDAAAAVQAAYEEKDALVKAAEEEGDAAKIEAAKLARKHAKDLEKENLGKYADDLQKQIDKFRTKFDAQVGTKTFKSDAPYATYEEIQKAMEQKLAGNKIGQKVEAKAESNKSQIEAKFTSIVDEVVKQINAQSKNGGQLAINATQIKEEVKKGYDFSAYVTADASKYTSEGEMLYYVKDNLTDADKTALINNLNNKKEILTANKEVDPDTLFTAFVVESKENIDVFSAGSGQSTVDMYRVIWFDLKDKAATTTTETTTSVSSETTTTESSKVESTESTPKATTDTTKPTDVTESTESTESTKETTTTGSTESSKQTTTTDTTKKTETTTTTTEETTTTTTETTKNTKVSGQIIMNVTVKTELAAGQGYYYSNDENAFDVQGMIDAEDESPEMEGKVDNTKFTYGLAGKDLGANYTPAALYAAYEAENKYVVKNLNLYYNGLLVVDAQRNAVTVPAYVGVKGDITQDGKCNSVDANRALLHAAQVGTTKAGDPLPTIEALGDVKMPADAVATVFDKFVIFLGDTNTESVTGEKPEDKIAINAVDASDMLRYAAHFGANPPEGSDGHLTESGLWKAVLGTLPTYSASIAN
jgi:hypothetical protein